MQRYLRKLYIKFDVFIVVDAINTEAEEFEEFLLVASEVGHLVEGLGGYFGPELFDF